MASFSFPPPLEQTPISATLSSPPYDSTTEVGTGGKLRTRRPSLMRKKTPYDRPTSGRHARNGGASLLRLSIVPDGLRSNIASRFVDSASRVLTSSASYLFSSIFKWKPPLPVLGDDAVAGGKSEEDSLKGSPSTQAQGGSDVDRIEGFSTEGNAVKTEKHGAELLEIEKIMKDKTLSREQFSRLTEILRSRIADDGPDGKLLVKDKEDTEKGDSFNDTQHIDTVQSEAQRWREERKKAWEEKENPLWDFSLCSNALTPHLKTLDGVSSSPVEVARAFMGERSSRFTGPAMPIHGRIYEEQLRVKTLDLWDRQAEGFPEDRYRTPQAGKTWRRAPGALGTPYSRPHLPSVKHTVPQRWTPAPVPLTDSREILKRRSSVLDDNWATIGPIRRTRLKTLATAASSNTASDRALGSSGASLPYSTATLSGKNNHMTGISGIDRNTSACSSEVNDDKKGVIPSLVSVPVQSSETARKILETLEKLTPSPKGKSLVEELALVRERPPTELTPNMLNEHARKSMLQIDYPEFCESGPSSSKYGGEPSTGGIAANATRMTEHKKNKGKEKAISSPSSLASKEKNIVSIFEPFSLKADGSTGESRSVSKPGAILQVLKTDGSVEVSQSNLKPGVPDGTPSGLDKKKGFRMSAVFEESNSDDEGRICMKANFNAVCAAAHPVLGGKSILSQSESTGGVSDTFYASSPESTMKTTVSSFTFPLNSPPEVLFEPPTPIPMFSPPSTTGMVSNASLFIPATVSSDGKGPQLQFGAASADMKGTVFSFTGSVTSEQATSKPIFSFKHETKPEFAVSNAAVLAASSLSQLSQSEQLLSEAKPKSSPFSKATPLQEASSFSSSPVFSAISSVGTGNQLPQFSTPGISAMIGSAPVLSTSGHFSSPAIFSQTVPLSSCFPIGGTSFSTESGGSNVVSSSSLFGASNTASTISSSKQSPPLQFGLTGQGTPVSTSNEVEFEKSQKTPLPGSDLNAGKNLVQVSVSSNGSVNGVFSDALVAAASSTVTTMPTGMSPASLSFLSSSALQSTSLFGCSSAPIATASSTSFFGSISACTATGLPVSSTSSSFPFSFGAPSSSNSRSASLFGTATSGAAGLSGSTTGANIPSFGAASSPSFGAGNSSNSSLKSTAGSAAVGMRTVPSFGVTSTAAYGSIPSPCFGLASSPAFGTSTNLMFGSSSGSVFGSASTPLFGSSSSPFGASTAKPFGLFSTDSTSQSMSVSAPLFGSGFGMTSTCFTNSPSSLGFSFGGSLGNVSTGSAFSLSSGVSTSPFLFVSKDSPTVAHQPMFGSSSFGSSVPVGASGDTPANDQMNMEDSMAEEPPEVSGNVTTQPLIFAATSEPAPAGLAFGAKSTSTTGQPIFTFGSQASVTAAGQSLFTFAAQPASGQNPFAQPVNLDYGGGGFTPGASGGEKSGRRFIKARRTGGKKGK